MKTILLIQKKSEFLDQIKHNFHSLDVRPIVTDSFSVAWETIKSKKVHLILTEYTTDYGDGVEFCLKLRESGHEGLIVFLTHTVDEHKIVKAFKAGADDYFKLPMPIEEFNIRLKKYLPVRVEMTKTSVGELLITPQKRIIELMGKVAKLGKKEFEIFYHIVLNKSKTIDRRTLIELVYGEDIQYERVIDSHISHIRSKLWNLAGPKIQIQSIYGQGYTLIYQD
jgi:DNA-binding response OmpR family regulator